MRTPMRLWVRPLWTRPLAVFGLGAAALCASNGAIGPQDTSQLLARATGADLIYRQHVISQIHPSMRMASFALPGPSRARGPETTFTLAAVPEDSTDRLGRPKPASVETSAGLVYPVINRSAKGNYGGGKHPHDSDPETTSSIDLSAPLPRLRGPQSFLLLPWGESIGATEPQATRVVVASARPFESLRDVPSDMLAAAAPRLMPEGDGDLVDTATMQERESSAEPTSITIEGASMIAQAGAGFGAPPMPVEESDAGIMVAGRGSLFDPSHDNFSADRRGDRPDPVLARILGQPNLAPFALAMPNSAAISNNALHPAILLNLSGASLQKAQKCLSEAVYFESRSEPEDGQIAVAQVVLNRATSGFYPNDVCGVVFQNAHRYLGCQFTFACEGKANLIPTEPEPWGRAQKIAQGMLAGRLWLPKVGNATHYHATYVRPYWVRSMKKHDHIGLHVFYRPKAWEG